MAMVNGDIENSVAKHKELAVALSSSPGTRINIHLTIYATSLLLFLATTNIDGGDGVAPLGSFVYAMPDRYNPTQPMSTALYTIPSTLDLATRMAKVLARKLKIPCYVGGGINLSNAAGGGTVEEETEAFRAIVNAVVAQWEAQH